MVVLDIWYCNIYVILYVIRRRTDYLRAIKSYTALKTILRWGKKKSEISTVKLQVQSLDGSFHGKINEVT